MTVIKLLILSGLLLLGLVAAPGWNLILITLGLLLFILFIGEFVTGNRFGALITERNVMSLARFQMMIWTALILGTLFTFIITRIRMNVPNALDVAIDQHFWVLLGISTASLVGSPLILSTKANLNPAQGIIDKTAQELKEPAEDIKNNKQGSLYVNANMADARFSDMFQGDDIATTAHLDLAKVQMFFFTMIAATSFIYMAYKMVVAPMANLSSFPALSDGFVAILGISNAGYLGSKTVNYSSASTTGIPPANP